MTGPRHRLDDPVLGEREQIRAGVAYWRDAMLWRHGRFDDRDRFRLWELLGAVADVMDRERPNSR